MNTELKLNVFKHCQSIIAHKRSKLQEQLEAARESANSETKSSAGDKHETARALAQLEQENLLKHFDFLNQLQADLESIDPTECLQKVTRGALVKTDKLHIFFGLAIGSIKVEEQSIFGVSMSSPIGRAAADKGINDRFVVNGSAHIIETIS